MQIEAEQSQMRAAGSRDETKETHWRAVVQAFEQSGLTGPKFCVQNDLKYSQLQDWRKTIRMRDSAVEREAEEARRRHRLRSLQRAKLRAEKKRERAKSAKEFAEVKMIDSQESSAQIEKRVLDVVLKNGLTVRVGVECPPDFLSLVLSALGGL